MYLPCGSSQIQPLDPKGMLNLFIHPSIHPSFTHSSTQKNINTAQILKGGLCGRWDLLQRVAPIESDLPEDWS